MGFQPGNNANPRGRPRKNETMTAALRGALAEKTADGWPRRKAIAKKLAELAERGDMDAIRYVFDRIDGKSVERQEITGADGAAAFTLVFDRLQREQPAELPAPVANGATNGHRG